MARGDKGLEFKVGAFVFVGLAMLAGLVVQFGRVGEGFKTYYGIAVQFPDASGLLKGSDVLMSGAKVGRVSGGPRLLRVGQGVEVPLRIYDYVKIPTGSKFTVGSSGLLGDRFVKVDVPAGEAKQFLSKDATVTGARETGLDDLTREGGALVGDMRTAVQNVNATVTRLNEQALSPANLQNIKETTEHLNHATASLAESSKKIDGVVEQASGTMGSAKKAADDVQLAIADARKTIAAATQTMQNANQVVQQATSGKGLLPTLLSNGDLANDLHALVTNLRTHGVLFYRDSTSKGQGAPPPSAPIRKTGARP